MRPLIVAIALTLPTLPLHAGGGGEPTGACCFPSGNCLLVEEAVCLDVGGVWYGSGSVCNSGNTCPLDNDACADAITLDEGLTPFNTFDATVFEWMQPCAGQMQRDVWYRYEALAPGTLQITTCSQFGGSTSFDMQIVIYDGCACGDTNLQVHACSNDCGGGGAAQVVAFVNPGCYLVRVGGLGQNDVGNGYLMVDGPNGGGCCLGGGMCEERSQAQCDALGGTWMGPNTSCLDCATACCFPDGTCQDLAHIDCSTAGGQRVSGFDCASGICDEFGACCFDDGTCQYNLASTCVAVGGVWLGAGTFCDGASCPGTSDSCVDPQLVGGADILPFSTFGTFEFEWMQPCQMQLQRDVWFQFVAPAAGTLDVSTCSADGGATTTPDVRMIAYPCECGSTDVDPLACSTFCADGSTMSIEVDAGQCILIRVGHEGGSIGAAGLVAFAYDVTCPCDTDGSGTIDTADLLALLGSWGTGAGDCTGDGNVDTADLLALLGGWGPCE